MSNSGESNSCFPDSKEKLFKRCEGILCNNLLKFYKKKPKSYDCTFSLKCSTIFEFVLSLKFEIPILKSKFIFCKLFLFPSIKL